MTDAEADLVAMLLFAVFAFGLVIVVGIGVAAQEKEQEKLQADKLKKLAAQPSIPQDGHLFEQWVAQRLRNGGWEATVTQGSGDQGIDVICIKNGYQFGIQCKRVSRPSANKAVQEVISGGIFHNIPNLAVVSSGGFTESAINLANRSNVTLLLPSELGVLDDLIQS